MSEWKKTKYTDKLNEKCLYATHLDKCWKITSDMCEEVPALESQHEEADGRMLLHAAHALAEGFPAVVICAEDTDVFILCLAFNDQIDAPLFKKCGTRNRTRLVDITKVAASIGSKVCKALVGMHACTGCDTVSAFGGKAKLRALQILKGNEEIQDYFIKVGEQWKPPPELQVQLEEFVCQLHAAKPSTTNIDELRYNLFCARKGGIESHQLPPCKDCLQKHILRANYQAGIWKRCLENDPDTPSPVGNGWKIEEDQLVCDWMDGAPAPVAVLDLLACSCSRSCKPPNCVCLQNGLKCTDMCKHTKDCVNQTSGEHEDDVSPIDDASDEDDDEDDTY